MHFYPIGYGKIHKIRDLTLARILKKKKNTLLFAHFSRWRIDDRYNNNANTNVKSIRFKFESNRIVTKTVACLFQGYRHRKFVRPSSAKNF